MALSPAHNGPQRVSPRFSRQMRDPWHPVKRTETRCNPLWAVLKPTIQETESLSMTTPKGVQQQRTKGWQKPDGAISVARPHKWGNPFEVKTPGVRTNADAVELYRVATRPTPVPPTVRAHRPRPDVLLSTRPAMPCGCAAGVGQPVTTATADLTSALINLAARGLRRSGRLTVSPV